MGSRLLHAQNGIFRVFRFEIRQPGGSWKAVRGDETMSELLRPGVTYEVRVRNPRLTVGVDIPGNPVEVPDVLLPTHD